MTRRLGALSLALVTMALVACGGEALQPTSTAVPTRTAVAPTPIAAGASCAAAVREEFTRQQSVVAWDVYCPSNLPDGFRLARPGDPRHAPYVSQDYTPTVDDLNPGGGTFLTRLVRPDGRDLMIVQGAGASIFARHSPAGPPEATATAAAFGDLQGALFTTDPPGVRAFDRRDYGHMVEGYAVPADLVARFAAAMRPVDPSGPHRALLALVDLHSIDARWVFAWPPDSTGEDVANPQVCGSSVDAGARAATAVARFEPAAEPGAPPDVAGHGPFLRQAVIRFDGDTAAAGYLDRVRQAAAGCAQYSPSVGVTVTVTPLDAPSLGDAAVAFRRSLRSPVQGTDADIVMIRIGDLVAVLLHAQTVPAGGDAAALDLSPYVQLAASRLQQLDVVVGTPEPGADLTASP